MPPSVRIPNASSQRSFVFEEHSSPWSHKGFVEALAAEDRSILILAGLWLEHQILAIALHALVDGYDVCVLLDATAARCPHASQPARERLNQAGATPVVTSQVIHEWTIEAPDAAKRVALDLLLSNLMQAG
jgi:nicotinamidase-related amidase